MSSNDSHDPASDRQKMLELLLLTFQEAIAHAHAHGKHDVRSVELRDGRFYWQVEVARAGLTTVVWDVGAMEPQEISDACAALERALRRGAA